MVSPGLAECVECTAPIRVRFDYDAWDTLLTDASNGNMHSCAGYRALQELEKTVAAQRALAQPTPSKPRATQRGKRKKLSEPNGRGRATIPRANVCNACGGLLAGRGEYRVCFHCGA